MALKKAYAQAADIPEALRSLYKQVGNQWLLDLDDEGGEGGELERKLAEFRANNRTLLAEKKASQEKLSQLEQRLAALGDADPDQIQEALALFGKLKDHEDAQLIKQGRIDDVLNKRMKAREADWQKKLADAQKERDERAAREAAYRERAGSMMLERKLREALAARKFRLRPSAEEDLLARARRDWKLGEDIDADPVPANDRFTSLDEYVQKLPELAPHYFEGGGGAETRQSAPGGRMEGGVRVVKRSEIPDGDYAAVLKQQNEGKVRVVME